MQLPRLYSRIGLGMLAGIACGMLISEATYFFLRGAEVRTPQVIRLTIPTGTAFKIGQGRAEASLPGSMTFVVGDTLLVENQDVVPHQLGPLFIPSGSSARLRLESARAYEASCTFQPSGRFGLEIKPPLTLRTRLFGMLQAGIPLGLLFVLYGVFAVPQAGSRKRTD